MFGPNGLWVKPLGWASLELANLCIEHPGYGARNPIPAGYLVKVGLQRTWDTRG